MLFIKTITFEVNEVYLTWIECIIFIENCDNCPRYFQRKWRKLTALFSPEISQPALFRSWKKHCYICILINKYLTRRHETSEMYGPRASSDDSWKWNSAKIWQQRPDKTSVPAPVKILNFPEIKCRESIQYGNRPKMSTVRWANSQ